MKVSIEAIETVKYDTVKELNNFSKREPKLKYADLRLEIFEGKSAAALQGNVKGATEDYSIAIGVRSLAEASGITASGFAGKSLGKEDLDSVRGIVDAMLRTSFKRAKANAQKKEELKKKFAIFGKNVHSTEFAEIKAYRDFVKAKFRQNPRDCSLEDLIKRVEDCSKSVQKITGIASNSIGAVVGLERKLFASTEGAIIDQSKALSEAFVYVAAKGKAIETYSETLGGNAGSEVFNGRNVFEKDLEQFAEFLAKGTVELSNAPAMKRTENVHVITDSWYNALLSHEITGHPSEADRALKREAAWAGRAWWFRDMEDNEFGKQVASELVTIFSDPTIEGYGHYKYDDEGVKAKRIRNIEKGILNEFINSRETALILGKEPNGGMRASSADLVPLIRMNNTCFAPGDWKKEDIFNDTREGYYAVGQKTPSIGETRQNFKITCWKLYKIENGEPTQLYRMGGITGDSYTFLKSIDAVGNDFRLYNIPNCGKGTPMQVMKVGNGGPHIRGKATVSGAHMIG